MRKMFAIVAGGIIPAAVEVEGVGGRGAGLDGRGWQRQVMIGLIEEAGGALAFEIIQDIGERRFFKDVGTDDEGPGGGGMAWPECPQPVSAGCGIGGEVDCPELPILP